VNNIRIVLGGIEWDGVDYVGLVQDRDQLRALMNAAMNIRAP
jgi:hypothetical protein